MILSNIFAENSEVKGLSLVDEVLPVVRWDQWVLGDQGVLRRPREPNAKTKVKRAMIKRFYLKMIYFHVLTFCPKG